MLKGHFSVLLQQLFEDGTEFLIAQLPVDAGAGLANDNKVIFIGQNAWMQRPLAAAPGTSFVDRTAGIFIIKNTVMIFDFHLYHVAAHLPVFFPDFLTRKAQLIDHSFLVMLVQGDRCLALAAVTATAAGKYIGKARFLFLCSFVFVHFDLWIKKNAPAMKLAWCVVIQYQYMFEITLTTKTT